MHLEAGGTYNKIPVTLSAVLGSFAQLHDAAVPADAVLHLAGGDTTLDFTGTMTARSTPMARRERSF